jgi:hypothetical protein
MIEIERLEKTFIQPGGDRVPALRGVDLVIPKSLNARPGLVQCVAPYHHIFLA